MNCEYIKKCGILLQKVISAKHPLNDEEYGELLYSLKFDQEFEYIFKEYTKSLGLKIITPITSELVVIPSDTQSPYYMRYSDYLNKLSKIQNVNDLIDKKAILLMIYLSIIASFYPSEYVINNEFEELKFVTLGDVKKILVSKAEFILKEYPNQEFANNIAYLISQMPHKNDNEDRKRLHLDTSYLDDFIISVLQHLSNEKFLSQEEEKFYIKNKFKILIKYYFDDILIKKFIEYKGETNV